MINVNQTFLLLEMAWSKELRSSQLGLNELLCVPIRRRYLNDESADSRQTDTDRQTEKGDTDRQAEKERYRKTDGKRETEIDRQTERQTDRQKGKEQQRQ